MNKREVDRLLPEAYKAIQTYGIADAGGNVSNTFRGQIAAFGAAVSMGSLLSAVAFFSAKGGSKADRPKLMEAIYKLVAMEKPPTEDEKDGDVLFQWVSNRDRKDDPGVKEQIINAAIAIKLAINLYHIDRGTGNDKGTDSDGGQADEQALPVS